MTTELNDPRTFDDDLVERLGRRFLAELNIHLAALKQAVNEWEPRPTPPDYLPIPPAPRWRRGRR